MRVPRVKRRKRSETIRRGFYLLPSLFTVANMFCGFLAMVESTRGHFERASVLILVAIFADALDGRIARLTGTATAFGEAYDSLADVVSFGAAPAMLAYQWGLSEVHRVGMAVVFLFLVAGSIRLARFNVYNHDSLNFVGLPIPAGAGAIVMLVLMSPTPVTHPVFIPVVAAFVLALALLMVSNLPYRSFKGINLRRQWPAPTLFLIALVFSLVTLTPYVLAVLAALYILSAPVADLARRVRRRPRTPDPRGPHEKEHNGAEQAADT